VLDHCTTIFLNDKTTILTEEARNEISHQINSFATEGYRVLAMASRQLPSGTQANPQEVEREMTFLGLAALHDPPRPNAEAAVQQARRAGVNVIMITGDYELTAEAIAKRIGIITEAGYRTVTGVDLTRMTDEELAYVLETREVVFARTAPEHKLRVVRALMAKGETVAVTGDGVNDSPSLIEANVGVAMGWGGTDVARESADMVLLDNDFTSIIESVKLGRATFDNLRKFIYYVYTHNFAELATFVAFIFLGVPLPLLVVQVLAIDLVLEIPVSLALIAESPEPDVMERPPRTRRIRLMDAVTLLRAAFIGVVIGISSMRIAFSVWERGGWSFGVNTISDPTLYALGTTIVMVGIMAGQLGNLFSTRTGLHSILSSNPVRNKWILIGVLAQLATMVLIVYMPLFQRFFGTASLTVIDWLVIYMLAPVVLVIAEIMKFFSRAWVFRNSIA
jgi:magnesium-transporting ATPase (P-type)